ncbi:MAG: hypothetical protein Fur003_2700 [Candidatus Dojkabacteria bacterium]
MSLLRSDHYSHKWGKHLKTLAVVQLALFLAAFFGVLVAVDSNIVSPHSVSLNQKDSSNGEVLGVADSGSGLLDEKKSPAEFKINNSVLGTALLELHTSVVEGTVNGALTFEIDPALKVFDVNCVAVISCTSEFNSQTVTLILNEVELGNENSGIVPIAYISYSPTTNGWLTLKNPPVEQPQISTLIFSNSSLNFVAGESFEMAIGLRED